MITIKEIDRRFIEVRSKDVIEDVERDGDFLTIRNGSRLFVYCHLFRIEDGEETGCLYAEPVEFPRFNRQKELCLESMSRDSRFRREEWQIT